MSSCSWTCGGLERKSATCFTRPLATLKSSFSLESDEKQLEKQLEKHWKAADRVSHGIDKALQGRNEDAPRHKRLLKGEILRRETIIFLLNLPPEQRNLLEEAENYCFTMASPAPTWDSKGSPTGSPCLCRSFEGDSIACARLLTARGSVAVLNFAHGYNCGGGFEHAAGSQEEAIFRSTSAPRPYGVEVVDGICMLRLNDSTAFMVVSPVSPLFSFVLGGV